MVIDLGVNLLAALIGVIIGWLWNTTYQAYRLRGARKYWRAFSARPARLVLGRFLQFASFEPSGMIGMGDAAVLMEIKSFFEKVGLGEIEVHYSDQVDGDCLKSSLILVGGPEANLITRDAAIKLMPSIQFGYPDRNAIAFYDTATGKEYLPWKDSVSGEITMDYGLIITAPNPFALSFRMIILAGSFGYGSIAAARFALSRQFWEHPLVESGKAVECLIQTDVVKETPQETRVIMLREIQGEAR